MPVSKKILCCTFGALTVAAGVGCARLTPPVQSAPAYQWPVFKSRPAGQKCTFAVWGDSGDGGSGQWELARQIEKQNPDLLLHTGDLIYPRGEAKDYEAKFFRPYASLLRKAPFYGALGNHDNVTEHGKPFLEVFRFPANGPVGLEAERNYWFDYGDARVLVLDSTANENVMKTKIAPWLKATFVNAGTRWKIVAFHHPPFSSGLHGDDLRVQRALVPALEQSRVDVVFNGHDHLYERFAPRNGVLYVVTGAGGASRYKRVHQSAGRSVKFFNDDWSFTRVDMTAESLRGQQITRAGKIVDDWSLTRRHASQGVAP